MSLSGRQCISARWLHSPLGSTLPAKILQIEPDSPRSPTQLMSGHQQQRRHSDRMVVMWSCRERIGSSSSVAMRVDVYVQCDANIFGRHSGPRPLFLLLPVCICSFFFRSSF